MTIKRAIKKLTIVTLLLGTLANCAQTGKISKDDSKVLGKDGIRSVEVIRENRKLSQFEINQQLDNAIELINIAARFLPQLNDVRAYLIDQDIERYKKQAREPLEKVLWIYHLIKDKIREYFILSKPLYKINIQ